MLGTPRSTALLGGGWVLRAGESVYLTIRGSALGFTLLLPLLGAASTQRELPVAQVPALLAVALAFHIFAYVLNDVADLWLDRTEPLRADSPLVRGVLSRRAALALAWSQPPLAFAFALQAGADTAALAMLGHAFLAMTSYDLYGKRCPWPLATDAIQATGWCALALFGAWTGAPVLRADTVWLLCYIFLYVLQINGIHGGLRDLANDYRRGARTTAIWLGARPRGATAVTLAWPLTTYALLLQGALMGAALLTLHAIGHTRAQRGLASVLVIAVVTVSTAALFAALTRRGQRRALLTAGALHIVVTLATLPALYLPLLGLAPAMVVAACFALPVAAMYVYNGSHWRL
jgi:4-hydroxybenzoate polyprenyltransferase